MARTADMDLVYYRDKIDWVGKTSVTPMLHGVAAIEIFVQSQRYSFLTRIKLEFNFTFFLFREMMNQRRNSTFTRRDSGEYVRDDGKAADFIIFLYFIRFV